MREPWSRHLRWMEREHHRRRRRRSSVRDVDLDPSESFLEVYDRNEVGVDEESAAQQRTFQEEKADFVVDLVKKGIIVLLLLVFLPPVGVVFGLIWGFKLGRQFFRYLVEPELRARVLERVETGEQVRHGVEQDRRDLELEHSRSLEKLSASIAHEIRNPITAAKSLVQQMGEDPTARDNAEYSRVALAELERVERSISHLLRFARDEHLRRVELELAEVLDSAIETFRDRAARESVEIVREFDCPGALRGDPEKLRRVAINLLSNAFEALDEGDVASRRIEVSLGENLAGTEVWLRVRDNGVGMDAETRSALFSPFVTSKSAGTGLGMPITKKIVESHAGSIEIHSSPGEGTEFILTFPKNGRAQGDAS